jgi:hypothetical protein
MGQNCAIIFSNVNNINFLGTTVSSASAILSTNSFSSVISSRVFADQQPGLLIIEDEDDEGSD